MPNGNHPKRITVVAGPNGSGKTTFALLKEAKAQGYSVAIYFVCVDSVGLSLKRIKQRVAEGGHDIPKASVIRRNLRCFANFWNLYRSISDDWYLFDNSKSTPRLVLSKSEFETFSSPRQKAFESEFLKGRVHARKKK